MKNIDTVLHVRGESQFVDDVPVPEGLLYAAVLSSPIASGKITHLNLAPAKEIEGIYDILTAADIPADNQVGNMIRDEPLLADSEVHFIGQPIALVVGSSAEIARMAMLAIEVQGLGWMTLEELTYANNGRLKSGTLSTYKVPDIYFAPQEIQVHFLENSENPQGLFNSKAIGEPPLMYSIGVYFAILQAMKAFRPDLQMPFSAPLTPEKVLLSLYDNQGQIYLG